MAEYVTSQSLVRGKRDAGATGEVDLGTGRARPEDCLLYTSDAADE